MYYVIYKYYTEYNQFEGIWDLQMKKCESYSKIRKWIKDNKNNSNIKDIIGPLRKMEAISL